MVKPSCYRVGVLGSLCLAQILMRSMAFYCKAPSTLLSRNGEGHQLKGQS